MNAKDRRRLNDIVNRCANPTLDAEAAIVMDRRWREEIRRHGIGSCDLCGHPVTRDEDADDWRYMIMYSPIIDRDRVDQLNEDDRRFLVRKGNGIWALIQACPACTQDGLPDTAAEFLARVDG